ncbi:Leucine-rich repeat and guanylate kinase domain-containing protein [Phytophthora cinnamomi]|uniref:Leucine-rich repeat and guanylate kinase domain-containing protein n=1 Tax=Phytophthora cinnamomi TaxID=4785 RepID=UPI00355997DC|nr:Leucine-rich repeat and guanylate kinase domain-containing protein [Phytophthora cinnamomi]
MSKEGFLLLHDEGRRSHIYYCVLGEGKLQFYSRRDRGVMVREVVLSRSRLKVRGVPDADGRDCPYSFSVRLQRSRIRDGRVLVYGAPVLLVMSAPTWGERKAWGNAIHAWQRNYWGEPQHKALGLAPDELEVFFETQFKALQMALQTSAPEPPARLDGERHKLRKQRATAAAAAAVAVPKALFGRAQAVKKVGNRVSKKLREKAVTFSLPPMGLSVSTSVQNPPTV